MSHVSLSVSALARTHILSTAPVQPHRPHSLSPSCTCPNPAAAACTDHCGQIAIHPEARGALPTTWAWASGMGIGHGHTYAFDAHDIREPTRQPHRERLAPKTRAREGPMVRRCASAKSQRRPGWATLRPGYAGAGWRGSYARWRLAMRSSRDSCSATWLGRCS